MGTDPPENPEAQRPSPAPTAAKPDGDAASETSSAQSSEPSDRKDAESLVLSTRSEEYRFLFRLSPDDVLLQDFNCAIHENILLQGHMYLFTHHICFYSNIFGFETKKIIPFHEVTCVRKAKTVAIFHNAIEILAGVKRVTKLWYFFGSFLTRDEAYRLIVDVWVQHGGDVRAQDTKLEASSQDDAIIIFDKVKGGKALLDDSSSSNRSKDAKLSEEFKSIPNGKVDSDISIRLLEIQENEGEENVNKSLSQNPFSWTIEDIDAPKVPEHFAIVAESKFPLLVEDFFSLFVSDRAADFLKDFHTRCGDKDFQCTSWHRHEQFGYTRNVSFLHPVKVYLGAKFGNCQEVQKFHVFRNSHLVIETSQQIDNVPYGDYFQVEGIWDVEQASKGENSCTVKVYSNVAFSKKTMFKGKIEQSTREESKEVYATWISIAHETLKEKNIGQSKAGLAEQDASMVHENNSELGSPPKLEGSTQNSTLNSTYLSRNIHEITNCNSGIDNHMKEKSQLFSPLMSIFREPWATFCSHMKAQSLLATILAVAFIIFILMQLSIILLLARVPEVHLVTHGNYNMENVEWLEKRFNYLKEEMLMVESRLERMRHEYALLKSYLQSLEQLRAKS
uniref:VASt domain-containing protein n=1 Tax=Musa acuminata subsp. malaccensis TaxID=214687 RepID=A0A804LA98_MUSAM|nr:PREDICTED: protein VASCULAR ASSOCIATED DEATH 1, chloroplastic-like isoform X1 [Musa acuminata subsp. malaccensis]XP_009384683.1 PREDICTED: protein VASCULAR ASSOCIATED DEATH 1, chloroplastic-like isoform X1 [Musa acuminata subsp. malaccensis]